MGYYCSKHLQYAIDEYSQHAINQQVMVRPDPNETGTCGKCNDRGAYLVTYTPS